MKTSSKKLPNRQTLTSAATSQSATALTPYPSQVSHLTTMLYFSPTVHQRIESLAYPEKILQKEYTQQEPLWDGITASQNTPISLPTSH